MNTYKVGLAARGCMSLAAVVGSVLSASSADAQQAGAAATQGIEEIVVTATRREERLQDVPLAVSAINADALRSRNIVGLGDITPGMVPNVNFVPFAGTPTVLAINIRGIGLSDSTQGTQELAVPVYIDGVYLGRGQGLGLQLIEPERVEILRGPQGQLFGRNAEGGVVQYITKKPTGELNITGSAAYGNYNYERYRGSIDLPKFMGFSTQFAALGTWRDAYTDNVNPGTYTPQRDFAANQEKGYRAAVRWQTDDNRFTADLTYDYSHNRNTQPYLTWVPVDVLGRPPIAADPSTTKYPNKSGDAYYEPAFKVEGSGYGLTLAYDLSDQMTLKSITAYRQASRDGGNTLGGALVAGGSSTGFFSPFAGEYLSQDQTSEELQFIGTWDEFELTAGGTYYTEDVTDKRISNLNGPGLMPPHLGISPPTLAYCGALNLNPCPTGGTKQRASSDDWGVYAQGTWRPAALDNKLSLIAGVRYSDDVKDGKRYAQAFGPLPFQPVDQKAHLSENHTNPAFTIKYDWTDVVNTYFRFATGYRAGGVNVRSSQFTSYKAETLDTYELGLKSQWFDRTLQANLAFFYNIVHDQQQNIQEAPTVNPSLTNTVNLSKNLDIKGAEAEFFWAAMEGLNIGLNLGYLNAPDYNQLVSPYAPYLLTRFYNINVPEFSGSTYFDYTRPLSMGELLVHADYSYTDKYWTTPGGIIVASLGPKYERPSDHSSQLTARLSWKVEAEGSGAMTVSLWGRNLLNDNHINYGFDGCASGGGFCTYRADPPTYGVEVRYDY